MADDDTTCRLICILCIHVVLYVESRIWTEYRRREYMTVTISDFPRTPLHFPPTRTEPSTGSGQHERPSCVIQRFPSFLLNPLSFLSLLLSQNWRLQHACTLSFPQWPQSGWLRSTGEIDSKIGQATGRSTPGQLVHPDPAARTMSALNGNPLQYRIIHL